MNGEREHYTKMLAPDVTFDLYSPGTLDEPQICPLAL
jgi:hypothetical protein